eukprot:1044882-Pyramimonas_sp.AAC.1
MGKGLCSATHSAIATGPAAPRATHETSHGFLGCKPLWSRLRAVRWIAAHPREASRTALTA